MPSPMSIFWVFGVLVACGYLSAPAFLVGMQIRTAYADRPDAYDEPVVAGFGVFDFLDPYVTWPV